MTTGKQTGTTGDGTRVVLALVALGLALALVGAQCGCTMHVHLWGKYTIHGQDARATQTSGQEARGAQAGDGQDARAEGNQRLMDEAERIVTDGE